ncbi:MAG: hypothetical protein AAGK37_12455 [Pseudomonadota bacterium]
MNTEIGVSPDQGGEDGEALFVHRVELDDGVLRIHMKLAPLLEQSEPFEVLALPWDVPITMRRTRRNRQIVLHAGTSGSQRDPDLIALVADARRWMADPIEGRAASVAEIIK